MASRNPVPGSELLSELWQNAIELDDAWFHLASDHAKEEYRKSQDLRRLEYNRLTMIGDLWTRLFSSELIAIGYLPAFDNPVVVNSNAFSFKPSDDSCVDGVSFGGRDYLHVRVCPAAFAFVSRQSILQLDDPRIDATRESENERADSATRAKRAGGRPSEYSKSAAVLRTLFENEANCTMSPAKLLNRFASEFERQYPYADYQVPVPSLRTLREHLRQFRQQSAETGNN